MGMALRLYLFELGLCAGSPVYITDKMRGGGKDTSRESLGVDVLSTTYLQ